MEEINIYNYGAWFIDHQEGNLEAAATKQLFDFLRTHPHLQKEFDEFMSEGSAEIKLQGNDIPLMDWSQLKTLPFSTLLENEEARNYLYFKIAENVKDEEDEKLLVSLFEESSRFVKEFEDWKKVRLIGDSYTVDFKEKLYKSGLGSKVNAANFQEYCIAGAEEILNKKEEENLAEYAAGAVNKKLEIEQFKKTRIKKEIGIFYPDKHKLYRKEAISFWPVFRIAVAVAAVLIILFSIFNPEPQKTNMPNVADKNKQIENTDPLEKGKENSNNDTENTIKDNKSEEEKNKEPEKRNKEESPSRNNLADNNRAQGNNEKAEATDKNDVAANIPIIAKLKSKPIDVHQNNRDVIPQNPEELLVLAENKEDQSSKAIPQKEFKKFDEFAEDLSTNVGIKLLKKVKGAAENITGAKVDYKAAKTESDAEYLSYSVSIGNFTFSHSSNK